MFARKPPQSRQAKYVRLTASPKLFHRRPSASSLVASVYRRYFLRPYRQTISRWPAQGCSVGHTVEAKKSDRRVLLLIRLIGTCRSVANPVFEADAG